MSGTDDRVEMLNVNSPSHVVRVERAKYEAVRDAMLAVVPADAPGLTAAEIKARLLPLLPEALFPGGAKAGWWQKGVQLDLEARGLMARADTKPLRFYRL
ncbi:MAG: hypothetical protein CVT78_05880 [Alphaproteobacteria bacterium HGW-Alphaproteobacteria-17]|nr:MAG: hypothetical protein CVT78_05880 [Alphaproteobacteria bacterium HGW-Alphaproteobacteria-17]